jgi:hypothetical protein
MLLPQEDTNVVTQVVDEKSTKRSVSTSWDVNLRTQELVKKEFILSVAEVDLSRDVPFA